MGSNPCSISKPFVHIGGGKILGGGNRGRFWAMSGASSANHVAQRFIQQAGLRQVVFFEFRTWRSRLHKIANGRCWHFAPIVGLSFVG